MAAEQKRLKSNEIHRLAVRNKKAPWGNTEKGLFLVGWHPLFQPGVLQVVWPAATASLSQHSASHGLSHSRWLVCPWRSDCLTFVCYVRTIDLDRKRYSQSSLKWTGLKVRDNQAQKWGTRKLCSVWWGGLDPQLVPHVQGGASIAAPPYYITKHFLKTEQLAMYLFILNVGVLSFVRKLWKSFLKSTKNKTKILIKYK